jgi:hypothetical protein
LCCPTFVVDDVGLDEMTAELTYHARTEDVFGARSMEHGARENFGIKFFFKSERGTRFIKRLDGRCTDDIRPETKVLTLLGVTLIMLVEYVRTVHVP